MLNKADFVDTFAKKLGITKKDADLYVNTFINVISEALKKGKEVKLIGFGTFKTHKRAEKNGVNPQTGEKILIPAKTVPKFVPGKELKDMVK